MFRNILTLVLVAGLAASCQHPEEKIPEPDYNPYLLKLGKYQEIEPRVIPMDSLPKPVYIPAKGKRISLGKPEYHPTYRNRHSAGKSEVFSAKLETFETGPLESFKYIPSTGKRVEAAWPKWQPAPLLSRIEGHYPLSYLGLEHGLNYFTVRCMIEDRFGRIWIGTEQGGVSVWDGMSFMHFTVNEGLTSNVIFSLMEDMEGQIWIGTGSGVCVWDGHGITRFTKAEGLSGDIVNAILQDRNGKIWIGTDNGINIWDGGGFFVLPQIPDRFEYIGTTWKLLEDKKGNIWIGGLGLLVWNGQNLSYFPQMDSLKLNIRSFLADQNGHLWIGSYRNGPIVWNGSEFIRYTPDMPDSSHTPSGFIRYNLEIGFRDDTVWDLIEDEKGRIWIGTQKNGIYIWDGEGFTQFNSQERISGDFIRCLLKDRTGRVWIGTNQNGVTIIDYNGITQFTTEEGLSGLSLKKLSENAQGQIQVATSSGELDIWDGKGFKQFKTDQILPGSSINTLLNDSKGNIWLGGRGVSFLNSKEELYGYSGSPDLTGREGVLHILENQERKIWIGTYNGLFKWEEGGFTSFPAIDTAPPNFNAIGYTVNGLLEDTKGNIWLSSRGLPNALVRWEGNVFYHYALSPESWTLSFNLVEDPQKRIWAATNNGIFIWDGRGFTSYTTTEGLKFNYATSLVQDDQGNIWAGTKGGGGLMRLYNTTEGLAVEHYAVPAGLEGLSYNDLLADRDDNLWMATNKGLLRMPIRPDTTSPFIFLREVQPFFDFIDWRMTRDTLGKGGHPTTGKDSIPLAAVTFDSVCRFTNLPAGASFPHNINQLTFSWSGIHPRTPEKLLYSHFLKGQDQAWSPPAKENKASYINLPPGKYTFKVRAVSGTGVWSSTAAYTFSIRAPWYWAWWSKIWYALLLFSGLYALYRFQLNRRLAAAETTRLRELDQIKTRLYTNITHEFRTPLTVIEGMITQMEENPKDWFREGITMIRRNCRYLLHLVNQLLDLRKLESGKMTTEYVQGDIIPYLRYITESFHSLAGAKQIDLHFLPVQDRLVVDYDPEKLLHLVSNLLSNAIKFTPEGGNVYLQVEQNSQEMRIRVRDTGIGIPAEKLPRIFERFYQVDDSATRKGEGTGVGLAMVQELVQLFSGRVEVHSTPGTGTEFTVCLPITHQATSAAEDWTPKMARQLEAFNIVPPNTDSEDDPLAEDADTPLVLVVEDNLDVIRYLRACLHSDYRVEVAYNGREGIEKAIELLPDIIISDVMMPEKDGFELTQTLKKDLRTNHIPIVLLTAKADLPSKIEGLEMGADEYLPKPFHRDELEVRIRKLIELRKELQRKFSNRGFLDDLRRKPEKILGPEERFIQKALKSVAENLSDEEFGLEQLRAELLISRTQLHRKIKAITGCSTTQFIRSIRLQKAKDLLLSEDLNISEIAYKVGFRSLAYFSQTFSEEFGISPTDFRKGKDKK